MRVYYELLRWACWPFAFIGAVRFGSAMCVWETESDITYDLRCSTRENMCNTIRGSSKQRLRCVLMKHAAAAPPCGVMSVLEVVWRRT